ncbi:MAG: hypothetical protein HY000_02965 [Planctomycetes bacterium]|nr:hypothetical protein [Planctomycetota bacterium]
MTDIASKYALPDELSSFVDDGFLEVVSEDEDRKTIEFHIPSKRVTDTEGRVTSYSLTWIHPAYNEQFCHSYAEKPGDLPNFYVLEDTTDVGDEQIDGLHTVADLVAWLENLKIADVY